MTASYGSAHAHGVIAHHTASRVAAQRPNYGPVFNPETTLNTDWQRLRQYVVRWQRWHLGGLDGIVSRRGGVQRTWHHVCTHGQPKAGGDGKHHLAEPSARMNAPWVGRSTSAPRTVFLPRGGRWKRAAKEPWRRGQSGNPRGRPRGSKHPARRLYELLTRPDLVDAAEHLLYLAAA